MSWSTQIPQTNLIHAWPFDTANTTTSTATDTIGGSNATLTSVTLNGSGPNVLLNNAGIFNGSSSHGDTALANLPTTAFTISFWVNANASMASGSRIIANDHTDADSKGFQILANDTTVLWILGLGNGTTNGSITTTTAAPLSGWHMISYTWDGTNLLSYVDGVVGGSLPTFTGPIAAGTNNISFGFNPAYSGDFFNGMIAGVAIYNAAIGSTNITALYNTNGVSQVFNTGSQWPSGTFSIDIVSYS